MFYPANFIKEPDGSYVVTFRDIPEAITQGDTLEEAKDMAQDALITAMDFYFEDERSIPLPSKGVKGEELIEVPISISSKVYLLNLMLEKKVTQVELAKLLHKPKQEVTRIVNLHHATKIDTVAEALKVLGKTPQLVIA
ncbi:type II toxin-antitoxin system HicB family antitoxin [Acinetobacter sp. Ac_5812]|uniref:type II toxin-antitoxin system HicB family antitoxin n=1 Tax=Acinetobacter sp. Ac_5812 TaxID=1848937 RepID=UPI00148FD87E|nr:type II toxin-antitoxin system HicB family antitoxin [Acinetobacter sp. Ac_5812]NNP68946.1 antitoxin [Acinetobacter sp. Ac_5812]